MPAEPAVYPAEGPAVGTTVAGVYSPPDDRFAALARRWPRAYEVLGKTAFEALAWSGFLAGMELPGRGALLCRLSLSLTGAAGSGRRVYGARVADVDRRFHLITVSGDLCADGAPYVVAEIEAMVLHHVAPPALAALDQVLAPSRRLSGRTAVVVGASRGLGAALAMGLAGQGCRVLVGHRHAGTEIEELNAQLGARGAVTAVRGDATEPAWAQAVLDHLSRDGSGLDFLILNAAPTIGALMFEPAAVDRLTRYVADSVALVATPLAGLLAPLVAAAGRCLLVSSAALATRPAPWPHYVTAKSAVEGLVAWTAAQQPEARFFTARPGLVLTDQTNTPAAREQATPVERVAGPIIERFLTTVGSPGRAVRLDRD
ncbi:SDR family NAD(P)-dependent oxidoreductase [Mangrovihabitans endophyticus]